MTGRSDLEHDVPPLKQEAMDWAARFAIGPVTDDDREAFETWRRCSPAHREAYRVATDFLAELRELDFPRTMPARAEANDNLPGPGENRPLVSRRTFLGGSAAVASVAAGVIAAQSPLGLWPTLAELLADERTGPGERRLLTPMAGVDVEMNSRSSLSVTDDGVRLIAGEIFVDAAGPAVPFQVAVKDMMVAAQHARFNVNDLDTELCVTCLEGVVMTARSGTELAVNPGQAVAWRPDGSIRRRNADPSAVTAWRRGLLVFDDTPLASAVSEINRHYPGRLVLRGSGLEARPVTGTFHINQIELAVIQIQQLTGVSATRLPGGVVLLG